MAHCARYNSCVHYVYIVRCADGSLYTGYAKDPRKRVQMHNTGRGAKYTSGRRPVILIYVEAFRSRGRALRREIEVKTWPRAKKAALVSQVTAASLARYASASSDSTAR